MFDFFEEKFGVLSLGKHVLRQRLPDRVYDGAMGKIRQLLFLVDLLGSTHVEFFTIEINIRVNAA